MKTYKFGNIEVEESFLRPFPTVEQGIEYVHPGFKPKKRETIVSLIDSETFDYVTDRNGMFLRYDQMGNFFSPKISGYYLPSAKFSDVVIENTFYNVIDYYTRGFKRNVVIGKTDILSPCIFSELVFDLRLNQKEDTFTVTDFFLRGEGVSANMIRKENPSLTTFTGPVYISTRGVEFSSTDVYFFNEGEYD